LPRDYVEVRVEVTGAESRRFEVRAVGQKYEGVLSRLEGIIIGNGDPHKTQK
jgi:hypothetical protein